MKHPALISFCLLAAASARADSLTISDAWARATPPGAVTAAAYLRIDNGGDADRLLEVRSDSASDVQIHTMIEEGGMMRMTPLDDLRVPAGGSAILEPGGDHIMLIDIDAPLVPGETLEMTLVFEHAGELRVAFPIRDARRMSR
jgi:periplasmic copper chaperone A